MHLRAADLRVWPWRARHTTRGPSCRGAGRGVRAVDEPDNSATGGAGLVVERQALAKRFPTRRWRPRTAMVLAVSLQKGAAEQRCGRRLGP